MAQFCVLTTRPATRPIGDKSTDKLSGQPWERVCWWMERGVVEAKDPFDALAQAKGKWGGSPVIVTTELH